MSKSDNSKSFTLHAAFVQANTLKGHRYLDLAGIVLNRIAEQYTDFAVDPAGSVLKVPKVGKAPYAIRFSSALIWLHYAPVDSLAFVIDTAPEWINSIARDIEVTRYSRLGLRCEFFAPTKDIVGASALLTRKVSSELFQGIAGTVQDSEDAATEYIIRVPLRQYIAGIRAATVRITRPPRDPSEYPSDGLLFDVDIYRRTKQPEGLSRAETKGFLRAASEHVHTLLQKIGTTILEVDDGTASESNSR